MRLKIIALIAVASFFSFTILTIESSTVKIQVENGSRVAIEGSSNLKDIHCEAVTVHFPKVVDVGYTLANNSLALNGARIVLDVEMLDCGARLINKDMKSTLKADQFPTITMDIVNIQLPVGQRELEVYWQALSAKTTVQMAGVTRKEPFVFEAKKISNDRYRIIGSHEIKLSNYCLDPPTAMMGLVKVDDCFLIQLDLTFQAQ